ncbi:choice-of-anchor I family protein, partial [Pseudoalteromonas sp.]|uniref:choice-of-anchor I family protein n=1 Tax=Pseudoalteromonas sp. TaxID=53249 RepID=UPI00356224C3
LDIKLVGRAVLNAQSPEGAAEIVAFHKASQTIFAINSSGAEAVVDLIKIEAIDASGLLQNNEGIVTNTNLTSFSQIKLNEHTSGDANSIAISPDQSLLAVAMAAPSKAEKGNVAIYSLTGATPNFVKNVPVGYLPDMLTFTPDGAKILVANEGEPLSDYSFDGEGSISIISVSNGEVATSATEISLTAYNGKQAELEADGVVFANPKGQTIKGKLINTTVAEDLEPEYITVSADSKMAYISLQENNAIAFLDLTSNSIEVKGLGFKDWSNLDFDASDKDGGINFKHYNDLFGMYQPDTIASYTWQGASFIVSANEGDGREYFFDAADEAECIANGGLDYDEDDGCLAYTDESRVKDLNLAANFSHLNNDNDDIGRLKVTTEYGDADQDGLYEKLYTYGARSFSIWDQNGLLVFDSGDQVDRITASIHGKAFNNDEDANEGDTRSDAKGAEPEALAIGKIGEQSYAFLGLERMGGIMVFNITNPYNVEFVDYFINRGVEEGAEISGDLAPEGMSFIAAEHSPTGKPLLVVGNEISGSVSVWQIAEKQAQ